MDGNPEGSTGVSVSVTDRPIGERQLIDRARRGDPRAYEELVRMHQQAAFRTAVVISRSTAEAEEAVQDGFLKAWGALARFRPDAPFRPWLLAIVANEARSRGRASRRRRGLTERAMADPVWIGDSAAASAESTVLVIERRATLLRALGRLEPHHRAVLELRFLLDLDERTMAKVLHCRRGTVKSRLSRALERLRDDLELES